MTIDRSLPRTTMERIMREVGDKGEEAAKQYLCRKGFRWLVSNYRTRWAEIDLIMEDNATIVFVEVKKRQNFRYGRPEDAITEWKMRRIEQAAAQFIHQMRISGKLIRFDVVAIDSNGLRHYPDAFAAGGSYYI